MRSAKVVVLLGILILALLVSGCGKGKVLYLKMTAPQENGSLEYSDSGYGLSFVFEPSFSEMQFSVTNNSKDMIKLVWDDTVFVDTDGQPSRIIHYGVRYDETEKTMVPTLIPPGATLRDAMAPANRIMWTGKSWIERALVSEPKKAIGKNIAFFMCFDKNGWKKHIEFRFEILGEQQEAMTVNETMGQPSALKPGVTGTLIRPTFVLPNANDQDGVFEGQ